MDRLKKVLSQNEINAINRKWRIIVDNVVDLKKNPNLWETKQKMDILYQVLLADKIHFKDTLINTYKRIINIVDKVSLENVEIKKDLFKHDQEKDLWELIDCFELVPAFTENILEKLCVLYELSTLVQKFLDNIVINDQDPEIRNNRLLLLQNAKKCFNSIADFDEFMIDHIKKNN